MNTSSAVSMTSRQRDIATAALEIIGHEGMSALTTTRLAQVLGVTSGALFRHFRSRDAILMATVVQARHDIQETLPDPDLDPSSQLRALLRARVELLSSQPGIAWLLLSDEARLSLPDEAQDILKATVLQSRKRLVALVKAGVDQGQFRHDVPLPVLMMTITGVVKSLVSSRGLHGSVESSSHPSVDEILDGLFILIRRSP